MPSHLSSTVVRLNLVHDRETCVWHLNVKVISSFHTVNENKRESRNNCSYTLNFSVIYKKLTNTIWVVYLSYLLQKAGHVSPIKADEYENMNMKKTTQRSWQFPPCKTEFFFNSHCQEEKMQINPPKNIDKNQNKTKIKTPLPRENHEQKKTGKNRWRRFYQWQNRKVFKTVLGFFFLSGSHDFEWHKHQ